MSLAIFASMGGNGKDDRLAHRNGSSFTRPFCSSMGRYRSPRSFTRFATCYPCGNLRSRIPCLHFFPGNRRGNRRVRLRPDGIDRGQRASPRVLVIVDQNPFGRAFRNAVFGGDEISGCRVGPDLCQALGERPDLFLQGPAHDGHIDVYAARTGGFRIAGDLQLAQRIANRKRRFKHLREFGAGCRDPDRSADNRAGRRRRSGHTRDSDRCSQD